ncbi:UNVERIFIED_CONTAM: hypothetical protein RMT77_018457 [Armadillidium vulgare]
MSDNVPNSHSFTKDCNISFKIPKLVPNVCEKATDRTEEMAQFWQRMKRRQEINGVCDEATNENGCHQCPIIGRTRSLNAPSPIQQFGPCGRIMRNSAMVIVNLCVVERGRVSPLSAEWIWE